MTAGQLLKRLTSRCRRSVILLAAVALLALLMPTASQAASPHGSSATSGPNVAGTWSVSLVIDVYYGTPCTSNCDGGDTYTFTQTAPNTYDITNASGFETTDVTITPSGSGASVSTCWIGAAATGGVQNSACPGAGLVSCPTCSYFVEPMTFSFPVGGPNTMKGTIDEYSNTGEFQSSWTYTAVQTSCGASGGCNRPCIPASSQARGNRAATAPSSEFRRPQARPHASPYCPKPLAKVVSTEAQKNALKDAAATATSQSKRDYATGVKWMSVGGVFLTIGAAAASIGALPIGLGLRRSGRYSPATALRPTRTAAIRTPRPLT